MTLLLYGVFFILAAILIILVPEILVALIAGMLLVIGAVFIYKKGVIIYGKERI